MDEQKNIFLRRWLPVSLWMLFIFILSSVPGPDIPDLPVPFFHKVVHFLEYSVLAALWLRAFLYGRSGMKYFKPSILAWLLTAAFALSDEWHQTFTSGRSGRFEDVFYDVASAVIGIVLFLILSRRKITGDRY